MFLCGNYLIALTENTAKEAGIESRVWQKYAPLAMFYYLLNFH